MRIYTKTGDDGTTGLAGGKRRPKSDVRFEAIGTVDELNAAIGVGRALGPPPALESMLRKIQATLFEVGAELASPDEGRQTVRSVGPEHAEALERDIDAMTEALEPLRNFILPGGTTLAAQLHLARTICRRAERGVWTLANSEPVRDVITMYLNRLSDWLFVAARTANRAANVEDIKWTSEES